VSTFKILIMIIQNDNVNNTYYSNIDKILCYFLSIRDFASEEKPDETSVHEYTNAK